ncbi:GCN5-related N-acetyltransferase [Leptotrichia shahii]|jgi:putative acetyltransferase|uniref:GCN5-related N-acetyltransferase n=1 Tax=Leptotrichia shahii TaxID=157691 RepID=A0A510JVB1_9FUSO|nr:GNAT family N-acetyltransferase [Leptotrichia shahii]BBM41453.1 GCN5-related N-acetyltransferase [Leptotrichia shahii]
MKKNYKIRILDAKKDSDLLFKIVEHENEVFGEATVGNWNIKPFAKYGKVFVMLSDDKDELMSVIEVLSSFDRESAYVYGVSTVPKFQKNGYAKILLQFVMKTLKEMGIKKIELTVDMDNFTAKRIYEKLGFEIADNLDNEYGDNVERYLMRYLVK